LPQSGDVEPFERLAGDCGDDLEVLVEVQDRQPGEFGSGGDDQIWNRRCSVLAAVGQRGEDLDSARRAADASALRAALGPSGPSNQPPAA
jgi:hypothetical protein